MNFQDIKVGDRLRYGSQQEPPIDMSATWIVVHVHKVDDIGTFRVRKVLSTRSDGQILAGPPTSCMWSVAARFNLVH